MDIWKIYAYVSEGKVKFTAVFLYTGAIEADVLAKTVCEDMNAFAVDVTHIPVQVDDDYIEGFFYRDGMVIEPIPTVEEQVEKNTNDIFKVNSAIDDIIVAITPTEG